MPRLPRYWIAVTLVVGFVACILVMRGVSIWGYVWLVGVVIAATVAYLYRDRLAALFHRKASEWRSDAKQLALWTRLAFQRDRDAHATATMTHQMQFLQGRIMSPMNLFAVAAVAVALLPVTFGFQEWRINRIKDERDRACSDRELTRNDGGEFQTTRQSCADLGETTDVAHAWRTRAIEAEAARIRDIARIQQENELARIAEMERRQRMAQTTERQRRRQNEAITAALGGPSPDLDRSLCELAGRVDCASAGTENGAAPTPPAADVPNPGR